MLARRTTAMIARRSSLRDGAEEGVSMRNLSIEPGAGDLGHQFFNTSVDAAERIHAQDRLFPIAVQFEIGPIHGIRPILRAGKPDEVTTDFRARGLRRNGHGALNR